MFARYIFSMIVLIMISFIFGACDEDSPMETELETASLKQGRLSEGFPPEPGERWVYLVTTESGHHYLNKYASEAVNEPVAGYTVYRIRNTNEPEGCGDYIGWHPEVGEFVVATVLWESQDWDIVAGEIQIEENIEDPLPRFFINYGTSAGESLKLEDNGEELVVKALAYEDVNLPCGVFKKAMKRMITFNVDGEQKVFYAWIHPEIGIIKEEDGKTGRIAELIEYAKPGGEVVYESDRDYISSLLRDL